MFCGAGFRPGRRGPFVPAKGPKTMDAPSAPIGADGRQSEEGGPTRGACVLSPVEGLIQGRQCMGASFLWARGQASDQGKRTLQEHTGKSEEPYIQYDPKKFPLTVRQCDSELFGSLRTCSNEGSRCALVCFALGTDPSFQDDTLITA
jgi:hypothetical protein